MLALGKWKEIHSPADYGGGTRDLPWLLGTPGLADLMKWEVKGRMEEVYCRVRNVQPIEETQPLLMNQHMGRWGGVFKEVPSTGAWHFPALGLNWFTCLHLTRSTLSFYFVVIGFGLVWFLLTIESLHISW